MPDAAEVLDEVKGVGPSTRDALLDRYPDLAALAVATEQDLVEVRGVGPATAAAIRSAVARSLEGAASADLADEDELTPREAVATATSTSGAPARERESGRSRPPTTGGGPREPLRPTGRPARLPAAGDTTSASAGAPEAAGTGRRSTAPGARDDIREHAVGTVESVRDAALSLVGVVVAAINAGKQRLPEVRESLEEARKEAAHTASSLASAARSITGRERS